MKIFGISIVKNEADIIELSLTKASAWADQIFVMDNGSDDGTWEKVKALAAHNSKIVPWKQTQDFFHDGLRAQVFNEFKHFASPGDWWCARLDADEFYIDNPREFLSTRVKPYYHVVCSKHIQYQFTNQDLEKKTKVFNDETLNSLRFFDTKATSEVRFFKHRDRLGWSESQPLPHHVGIVCPERILIRHYQYRSLEQIQRRIKTRLETRTKYPAIFPHVASEKPEDYIVDATRCIHDIGKLSLYNELPLVNNQNLKYRWWVLLVRRLFHATGVFP